MRISNLNKRYGSNVVYENFNFEAEDGKITCILGESGCGKTTLLNVIAHLTDFTGDMPNLRTSYIFQTPRLVPNLTVYKNLTLVGAGAEEISKIAQSAQIYDKLNAYPNSLSGGQAQRVALCRAFLFDGDIILMDEPFTSLDLKLKIKMMELFLSVWQEKRKTALFVTHDVDEALFLADRIIIIKGGKIVLDRPNPTKAQRYGENSPLRESLIQTLLN